MHDGRAATFLLAPKCCTALFALFHGLRLKLLICRLKTCLILIQFGYNSDAVGVGRRSRLLVRRELDVYHALRRYVRWTHSVIHHLILCHLLLEILLTVFFLGHAPLLNLLRHEERVRIIDFCQIFLLFDVSWLDWCKLLRSSR